MQRGEDQVAALKLLAQHNDLRGEIGSNEGLEGFVPAERAG